MASRANRRTTQCVRNVQDSTIHRLPLCSDLLCVNSARHPKRSTATIAGLDWRARYRAVRAKNAAITGERLKPLSAAFAVVEEELARISGYVFGCLMAAHRAGNCGV